MLADEFHTAATVYTNYSFGQWCQINILCSVSRCTNVKLWGWEHMLRGRGQRLWGWVQCSWGRVVMGFSRV